MPASQRSLRRATRAFGTWGRASHGSGLMGGCDSPRLSITAIRALWQLCGHAFAPRNPRESHRIESQGCCFEEAPCTVRRRQRHKARGEMNLLVDAWDRNWDFSWTPLIRFRTCASKRRLCSARAASSGALIGLGNSSSSLDASSLSLVCKLD